jgi:hypothetical protein
MTPERAFNPIRSLESSWRLLNQAPLPLWLGGLILALIEMVGGAEVRVGSSSEGGEVSALWLLLALLGLVLWLVTSLASAYVGAGYFSTVREVMQTGRAKFEDVFNPRGRWVRLFLARIVTGLLGLCAFLPAAIPPTVALMLHAGLGLERKLAIVLGILGVLAYLPVFLYVLLGLLLVDYPVVFEGAPIGDAISRSWQLARGNRWKLLLFVLSTGLIAIVGMMLCCVGLLPAIILINVMWCEAYVQLTEVDQGPGSWWIKSSDRPSAPSSPPQMEVEAEPIDAEAVQAPPVPAQPPASDESTNPRPFDPGRWREDAGIPPIEEEE